MIKKRVLVSLGLISFSLSTISFADNSGFFTPKDIKWQAGPNALPKGAQVVVLEGDPSQAGPFTLRLKTPAKYIIPPHWHPVIEHVTVLSGEFALGMGDKFDKKLLKKLPAGSFAYMPPKMHHFAYTEKPTVLQLHGVGPWGITYVDPNDDPRNAGKTH